MDFFRVSFKIAVYNIPLWFSFFFFSSQSLLVEILLQHLTHWHSDWKTKHKLTVSYGLMSKSVNAIKALHPSVYFVHFLTSVTEV